MTKQNFFKSDEPGDCKTQSRESGHIEGPEAEFHHSKLGVHSCGLWEKNTYTDVIVKVNNKSYRAHRPVLSCYSTYFKEHIPSANQNIICLDGLSITSDSFEILLNFMYTGRLDIIVHNIGDLYIASRKLGIKKALKSCEDILLGKVRHEVQCIYLFATAKKLNETDGARRALEVMAWNFEQITGTKEFLDLKFDTVVDYLSVDRLAVRSEVMVYLAALRWLNYKFLERESYVEQIIGCVRFPMMTLNEVLACFSPPFLPGIIEIPAIEYMLLTATCYIASKTVDEQERLKKYACKPREYLLERMPLVLWDSDIFQTTRHFQYSHETAETMIQSGFRAHLERYEKKKLSFLYHNIVAPKIVEKNEIMPNKVNKVVKKKLSVTQNLLQKIKN